MPHPSRMCPEFYDGASVAAALIDAEESGIASDNSGGPVDLSTPSSSPFCRVPIRSSSTSASWINSGIASPRRDSLSSDIDPKYPPPHDTWWNSSICINSIIPHKKHHPGMPKVIENQREKFETDAVFRRLSRETEVRYAGVPLERPLDHRRRQFELDVDRGVLLMVSVIERSSHENCHFSVNTCDICNKKWKVFGF